MEGITDSPFRLMARNFGAQVLYTEFVSSDAIARHSPSALAKLDFSPAEAPVVCQIFGHNPAAMARAAMEIERRGFSGIDINFGCPARKVVGRGAGVALMRHPAYARELIESVLKVVSIPVSIKVRASIRRERQSIEPGCPDRYTAVDLVEAIRDLPVAAIMVHGRSFEQPLNAQIEFDMIQMVKQRFQGVVLANGGIKSPEDARTMLEKTGADGLGIARGALGRPWIFNHIRSFLKHQPIQSPQPPELRMLILEHAERAAKKSQRAVVEFRKHLSWYVRGVRDAARLRAQLSSVNTLDDVRQVVVEAFPG